jgi:hypothetical protein
MAAGLYMDVQVPSAITRGLRGRGLDVITAQDDNADRLEDPELLGRALKLDRLVFTRDDDFLAEATRRQRSGLDLPFATIIYAYQLRVSIGQCIEDLHFIAEAIAPEEMTGCVIYLPL